MGIKLAALLVLLLYIFLTMCVFSRQLSLPVLSVWVGVPGLQPRALSSTMHVWTSVTVAMKKGTLQAVSSLEPLRGLYGEWYERMTHILAVNGDT